MRLREVLTPSLALTHNDQRQRRFRPIALKAQQVIAECDGWSCELHMPEPMNIETGEVFHWTATAINEADDNEVSLMIIISDTNDNKLKGELIIPVLYHHGRRKALDLSLPNEHLAEAFLKMYANAIDDIVCDYDDVFTNEIRSACYSLAELSPEKIKANAKRDIFDDRLRRWMSEYKTITYGLVNSLKLANHIADRLTSLWNSVISDAIEHMQDHEAT